MSGLAFIKKASKPGERLRRRKIRSVGALFFATALVIAFLANSLQASQQRQRSEALYAHTWNVLLVAGELRTTINAALRGERGFLLTQDSSYLAPLDEARRYSPRLLLLTIAGFGAEFHSSAPTCVGEDGGGA